MNPPEVHELVSRADVPPPSLAPGATLRAGALELTARLRSSRAVVGEPLDVEVRLYNRTQRTLALLPALDGSDAGMRLPRITLEVRDAQGVVALPASPRCGNLNELSAGDFRAVPPGGSIDVLGAGSFGHDGLREFRPAHPGRYTLQFTYALDNPARWSTQLGGSEVRRLAAALPAGEVRSAPLEVQVVPR